MIRVFEGGVGRFGGGSDDRSIVKDFREARDLGRDDRGVDSVDISNVVVGEMVGSRRLLAS